METSDYLQIVTRAGVGRCVVAARDVDAGKLLWEEPSAAHGPAESLPGLQANMLNCIVCPSGVEAGPCSQCNLPVCSTESCRDFHEEECVQLHGRTTETEIDVRISSVTPFRLMLAQRKNPTLRYIWRGYGRQEIFCFFITIPHV
jgi:hypothetical protein